MLIATKPFTYNTRRLLPGDEFEAKRPIDAKLLRAAKKAREVEQRTPGKLPPPPTSLIAQVIAADAELPALRERYQVLTGKRPFMGWNAEILLAKMAGAE